jgi:hypothetical protein
MKGKGFWGKGRKCGSHPQYSIQQTTQQRNDDWLFERLLAWLKYTHTLATWRVFIVAKFICTWAFVKWSVRISTWTWNALQGINEIAGHLPRQYIVLKEIVGTEKAGQRSYTVGADPSLQKPYHINLFLLNVQIEATGTRAKYSLLTKWE